MGNDRAPIRTQTGRNPAMTPTHFDHVLVGTGQATGTLVAGLPCSESIAVVEGGRVGGTCVNTGCTPTKALVASAKVAHMVKRAADYGVRVDGASVDFGAVMARMNETRRASSDGLESWLRRLEHVTLVEGWASFEGPKTLRVGETSITGDRIYLNVGGRPRLPEIPGLADVPWLDNARILELDALPDHLVVLGGGYVGLEFGQMFRRFGADVTILEAGERLVLREDEDVSQAVRDVLEGEGIVVRTGAQVVGVGRDGAGGTDGVAVWLESGEVVRGSHLLVAAGRVPNSDRLNLGAAGITTDERGYVEVDDRTMTSVEDVFALGDVNGRGAFTHTSVNDAEIALDALRGGSRRLSDRIPVFAMFTDPPLARVGLTKREAIERGHRVLEAERAMSRISRAREMGETQGFVRLLVDADSDLILGATILGVHGDEVINMVAAFMYSGRPCRDYRRSVLVHPTVSEIMPWILDDLKPVT